MNRKSMDEKLDEYYLCAYITPQQYISQSVHYSKCQ